VTRSYTSTRRQQQAADTRALVLAAAARLFADRGWAATGMRDIAEEAGVSMVPLYAHFKSKSDLLVAAIDVGVVGDTAGVPLSQRPEFAALGAGTRAQRIAAVASMLTAINERSWALRRALVEAAGGDQQLRDKWHEFERWRRDNVEAGLEMVTGEALARDVLDGLWVATGADAFHLLTQVQGQSVDEYERWLKATINRLLGS
jgi:AcrR family transcriptional regulator